MNPPPIEGEGWSSRRWWSWVFLFFAMQVLVVLWLGVRGPPKVRPAGPEQILRFLPAASSEWLALNDPTLFALPHAQGFSPRPGPGSATSAAPVFEWAEDPDWLLMSTTRLGVIASADSSVGDLVRAVVPAALPAFRAAPDLSLEDPLPEHSRLRVEDDLAARAMLTPFACPDPTNGDLLVNTRLQLLVDAWGRPRSVTLLESSGSPVADESALAFARSARFAPLPGADLEAETSPAALARLAWGTLIFDWRTLPVPPTNSPSAQ